MSRRSCWFAGALLAALTLAPLSSLAFDQGQLIKPVKKELTFVFVPKVVHPWYEVVQAGARKAIEEAKVQGIQVKLIWDAPPQADVADHNRRIETDIGRKPDGLAVSCLDPATNVQLLKESVKAGINTITFDTFCADDFVFVGHKGDYQDGWDLAEFLAKKIGDKGKVGILSGSLTATNHAARVKGFKDAMAKHPNIKIVFEQPDEDNLEKAVSLTENALQANPDLAGIFGSNASNPIGAARAVINAKKTGQVTIVGMDDLPETLEHIKDGSIAGVKAQRQWEIGYWGVKYLIAMNQNHTVPKVHATGSQILTKDLLK
ncbi:MAG: substrate-binding domain-containing protein [Anaeromyxobacter sp.]